MKKLFFLTIAFFFSVVIKAQTFIEVNNLPSGNINVYPGKFYTVCNSAPDCTMNAMTGIAPMGGSANQAYPSLCTNKNVMFGIEIGTLTYGHFYWCGTDLYNQSIGSPGGELYDVVSTGGGNITVTVHL